MTIEFQILDYFAGDYGAILTASEKTEYNYKENNGLLMVAEKKLPPI